MKSRKLDLLEKRTGLRLGRYIYLEGEGATGGDPVLFNFFKRFLCFLLLCSIDFVAEKY